MDILILGGTGVISTSIVDRLHELSHHVTVFNRGVHKARYRTAPEIITGDKQNREQFKDLLKDRKFDGVIDMISYNPEDAGLTLEVLGDRGGHFVFTSSVAAYKRPMKKFPASEDLELISKKEESAYGYHKGKMEAFLKTRMNEFPITIMRPSLTFGIGCRNVGIMRNNYGIVTRLRRHKPIVVFGDGTNPWAWTFAPDLAKAFAGVLCRPVTYGETYHATSDDHHVWDDLYREFGRCVGEEPSLVHISTEMLMKAKPDVFLHVFEEKMYSGIFDNSKIRSAVPEFVCTYTLENIVKALYDWYESDPEARIVDDARDKLEDSIVENYSRCLAIMQAAHE
jgi:nucleoside-diphosphate-sugar epimerase